MSLHDVLAFALAGEAVRQIRDGDAPWADVFSTQVHATASRAWPVPDFVIVDSERRLAIAGEFKPPDQSKREYLTGLGQAMAYTRDFDYALLATPELSDDGYRIADHIAAVLALPEAASLPLGLLKYDATKLSAAYAGFEIIHAIRQRATQLARRPQVDESFWAKWRDMSPTELGHFLEYLYDEGRPTRTGEPGTIRDRAFNRLWEEMVAGKTENWSGGNRTVKGVQRSRTEWGKNFRNFVTHIGWVLADGKLTDEGLQALRIVHQYGPKSAVFLDRIALSVLTTGKHLVLLNAINEFQDKPRTGPFATEREWLDAVETDLENGGLLKRNPGRHDAAVRQSERGFLKAEKTLWRNLGLFVPYGPHEGRSYHPGRGFIFDWERITSLLG